MIPYLLNSAKGIILKKWLDPEKPTIKEWFDRIDYIYKMEYLSSTEEAERFKMDRV